MRDTLDSSPLAISLAEQSALARENIPEEKRDVMQDATERLRQSGLVERAVGAGDTAPDFTLPDADGNDVTLSERLKDGPVVLSFYRGGWCPYCNLELRALQDALADVEGAGGQLLAVSIQTPDASRSTKEDNDLRFDVLSDADKTVVKDYGLLFELTDDLREVYGEFGVDLPEANGEDAWRLPIPATYVVGTDGTVRYAFADPDYRHRAEPAEVVEALNDLE